MDGRRVGLAGRAHGKATIGDLGAVLVGQILFTNIFEKIATRQTTNPDSGKAPSVGTSSIGETSPGAGAPTAPDSIN